MLLNKLDYLSPKITLNYLGLKNHSSKFGGILTILLLITTLVYIIILLLEVIEHESFSFFYYKKYEEEAGLYKFDQEGIFHFFNLYKSDGEFKKYDSRYVRVFGYNDAYYYNSNPSTLEKGDFWLYDLCEHNYSNIGMDKDLFKKEISFETGVCLKYYYNYQNKTTFKLTEEGFKYPFLEHGNSRSDNVRFGTIIEKCRNDSILNSILGPCGTEEEINNYLSDIGASYFYFINNNIDPGIYLEPIQKFFYGISGGVINKAHSVNNINFEPIRIEDKKGYLIQHSEYQNSYVFDQNRKDSSENKSNGIYILIEYHYWMQNTFEIYSRNYSTLIAILPTIGGIIEFLYYFFFALNYFTNKYTVLLDTKKLFFELSNSKDISAYYAKQNNFSFFNKCKEQLEQNKENINQNVPKQPYFSFNHINNLKCFNRSVHSIKQERQPRNSTKTDENKIVINIQKSNKTPDKFQTDGTNVNVSNYSELIDKNSQNVISTNYLLNETNQNQKKDNYLKLLNNRTYFQRSNIYLNNNNMKLGKQNLTLNDNVNKEKIGGVLDRLNLNYPSEEKKKSLFNRRSLNNNERMVTKNKFETNNAYIVENKKNKEDKEKKAKFFSNLLVNYIKEKKLKLKTSKGKIPFLEKKFSFVDYILSSCGNNYKKSGIYILDKFRNKLISEEHIYRSHINMFTFEKYFNIKDQHPDLIELYKYL